MALDKARGALEEAGASMDDIVKTILYLTRVKDYSRVTEKIQEYYRRYASRLVEEPPADTVIGILALHEPDMLVEIDTVAVMQR